MRLESTLQSLLRLLLQSHLFKQSFLALCVQLLLLHYVVFSLGIDHLCFKFNVNFEEQQISSSSHPTSQESLDSPSYRYRGVRSQDSPAHQEARHQQERDRRAHRAARRAGEEVPPTQELDSYLADLREEQDVPPSAQREVWDPSSTPFHIPETLMPSQSSYVDPLNIIASRDATPTLKRSITDASQSSQLSSSTDALAAIGSDVFSPISRRTSLPSYRGHGARLSFGSQSTPRRELATNHAIVPKELQTVLIYARMSESGYPA